MISRILDKQTHIAIIKLPVRYKRGILTALVAISSLSMGSAWSYESYRDPVNNSANKIASPIKNYPSSTVSDACKTLLVSNQQTFSGSITVKNHRTAGKIAALGVILGARFALEPHNNETNLTGHDNKVKNSNRSAQAVASFRKCQKEHVLSMVTYK